MVLNLDLRSADFHGDSMKDQIARCREMVMLATHMAGSASDEKRVQYLDLATRWDALADEMERHDKTRRASCWRMPAVGDGKS